MSEEKNHRDELDEIEATLQGMEPMPMKPDFLAELERDVQNVGRAKNIEPSPIMFARFIPIAAAACVALAGFVAMQMGVFSQKVVKNPTLENPPAIAESNIAEPDPSLIYGLPPRSSSEQLQHLSRQQFVRPASFGGYVKLEENGGLAREVNVEILEGDHFYDPKSESNIRRYIIHEGVVLEPVEAN